MEWRINEINRKITDQMKNSPIEETSKKNSKAERNNERITNWRN